MLRKIFYFLEINVNLKALSTLGVGINWLFSPVQRIWGGGVYKSSR